MGWNNFRSMSASVALIHFLATDLLVKVR